MATREETLLLSTQAYERLSRKTYHVTVGKNNDLKSYKLRFTPHEYKHLFGLHKLGDRPDIYRAPSERVFKDILKRRTDLKKLTASDFYGDIETRVENIVDLEQYIDSFLEIYDWDKIKARSTIVGNKMIPHKSIRNNSDNIYIFFNDGGTDGTELKIGDIIIGDFIIEIPVTFIVEPEDDLTANLVRPAIVLYKEKLDKHTQDKVIILDKLSK